MRRRVDTALGPVWVRDVPKVTDFFGVYETEASTEPIGTFIILGRETGEVKFAWTLHGEETEGQAPDESAAVTAILAARAKPS